MILLKKIQFHVSQNIRFFLPFLNFFGLRLTIQNAFPGIGDVLLLTSLVESIKKQYPNIRINVVTKHFDLLENNKNICTINLGLLFTFRHWYLEIRQSKNPEKHILTESLEKLGLPPEIQKPQFFITEKRE